MSGLLKYVGLDKLASAWRMVQEAGGVRAAYALYYRTDELKSGRLVGEDKYGNKYYENDRYAHAMNRWVIYNPKHHLEYDGSMIPAEWFGWMHHKTNTPPTEKAPVHYKWMVDHSDNRSGTSEAYVPYDTTRPKIDSWRPPSRSSAKIGEGKQ